MSDLHNNASDPKPVEYGGTGQTTAQSAINALTGVSGATNEHVYTKDTSTGNATWKAPTGGASSYGVAYSFFMS